MSATVADVLDRAADLVEQGWTRGCFARASDGSRVPYGSPIATCWCVGGALSRAGRDLRTELSPALIALENALGVEDIGLWNDDPKRTKAEVLAALRETAAAERGRGGAE